MRFGQIYHSVKENKEILESRINRQASVAAKIEITVIRNRRGTEREECSNDHFKFSSNCVSKE